MKRLLLSACLLLLIAAPALAHPKKPCPPKAELTGSASYIRPDGGRSDWTLGGELVFPFTKRGILLAGPAVAIHNGHNDDYQAVGAVIELNLTGASGLFIGAAGLYDADAQKGADEHSVDARIGLKFKIGESGLVKTYVEKTVDGYGKSEDIRATGALGIRF